MTNNNFEVSRDLSSLEEDFIELNVALSKQWKNIPRNIHDWKVIAKWVRKWTKLEKDVSLAEKIFNIFIEHHTEFVNFDDQIQREVRAKVTNYLKQDEELLSRLSELENKIINNQYSPNRLIEILQKIFNLEEFNREEYEVEIRELEGIGIIQWNSPEQPVTVHHIYQGIIELDNLAQRLREEEQNIQNVVNSEQSSPTTINTKPTNGLRPYVQLFRILTTAVFLILGLSFCVYQLTQTEEEPKVEKNTIPEKKCTIIKQKLRDIRQVEPSQLVDARDILIRDIDQFLTKNDDSSLDNICGREQLDLAFAKLLYQQSIRLAGSGYFGAHPMIRSDDDITSEYGAVRCLCLIPEKLLNSEPDLEGVKGKITAWSTGNQAAEVEAELFKLTSCPAANY
ncbi:MAG: hypothetical protein F6J92_23860 [Symploca sp. SIO1A3]|nr:hypothetical protein [Symploca sp. SIO1A3]